METAKALLAAGILTGVLPMAAAQAIFCALGM